MFWKVFKIISIGSGIAAIITAAIIFLPGFFGHNQKSSTATPTTPASTSSASLLGLDQAVSSDHFKIYYNQANAKNAQELLKIAERDYPSLANFFPQTPLTEILITWDANEYVNIFNAAPPWGGQDYSDPNRSAGSFCPGCAKSLGQNTEYIYMLRPGNRSFAHELSHRYYWSSFPNLRYNNDLTWLNEGLAVYIQDKVAKGPGGFSNNVSRITKMDVPASLAALNSLQQQGNLDKFYDLVGLLALYLDKNAKGGIKSFIMELNQNKDLNQTCQDKLGFASSELLSRWRETLQ